MRRFLPLAAVLLLASTGLLGSTFSGNSKVKPAASVPLQLTIRADHTSYRMSQTLVLETRFTNTGNSAIFLYDSELCWNFARGLVFRVVDNKGEDVRASFLLDCVPPPPRAGDPYQFIKIDPGRFYGFFTDFPIRQFVNGPGDYSIEVSFSSHLSQEWLSEFFSTEPIRSLPLWTMEKPTLKANRIHFTVTP